MYRRCQFIRSRLFRRTKADLVPYLCRDPGCGFVIRSQQGRINGHLLCTSEVFFFLCSCGRQTHGEPLQLVRFTGPQLPFVFFACDTGCQHCFAQFYRVGDFPQGGEGEGHFCSWRCYSEPASVTLAMRRIPACTLWRATEGVPLPPTVRSHVPEACNTCICPHCFPPPLILVLFPSDNQATVWFLQLLFIQPFCAGHRWGKG